VYSAEDGEAWGRSPTNPLKGWYGLKKGLEEHRPKSIPKQSKPLKRTKSRKTEAAETEL
jgi:hypothetical protein